jgi:hypothetical protein
MRAAMDKARSGMPTRSPTAKASALPIKCRGSARAAADLDEAAGGEPLSTSSSRSIRPTVANRGLPPEKCPFGEHRVRPERPD